MPLQHSIPDCFFLKHPYRFNKQNLMDYKFLQRLKVCDCFQFAILHNNPVYQNYEIELDEFLHLVDYSEAWSHYRDTNYKYTLNSGNPRLHRDTYVKEAFKKYDPSAYYSYCDANKTPNAGRMYFSLLQYLYPRAKPPPRNKERYFYDCMSQAINYVFSNFDKTKPIHYREAMNVMPKNTSAGFNGLQYSGTAERKKKSDILPFIERKYLENLISIRNGHSPDDYCMFAMRGHLSDRLKRKTRPVWLVSASTIVAELKYYQPFYDQIGSKEFFTDRWITGKNSLPRLNRYLRRHKDAEFINTDISGWDSYRAAWFHEKIMRELKKKLELTHLESREFEYLIDSAIRTKVLFPNGEVHRKKAGIISGTAGTLLFNSLLNTIAGYIILNMMKLYSFQGQFDFMNKIMDPNWLGDDFAFYTYYKFDLELFSRLMFKYFNVIIKPEKTIRTKDIDERKYLGYQIKDGFLFRPEKEFIQALLYTERPFLTNKIDSFAISFSRFFSYLLLGGINNQNILEFFYFYMGYWKKEVLKADDLFISGYDNIFKLLKDVWNVNIPTFKLETLRNINLELMKYVLLYGYDLKFSDLSW